MADQSIKSFVYRAGAAKRMPVSGTFELTPRCNLSCRMCYIHLSGAEQSARGRELTTEEWLSVGRQAVDAGMVYLLLTGGEPMLRKDFVTIYSEMVKMGATPVLSPLFSLIWSWPSVRTTKTPFTMSSTPTPVSAPLLQTLPLRDMQCLLRQSLTRAC